MKKITRKQIKAQMVPVLHRTEQERICAELTHDIGLASNVQDVVDDECNALSALPAALLRLAFSGKL